MLSPLPRLYPILDSQSARHRGLASIDAARAMLAGGARILQFRHKEQWTREVFAEAECIAALCATAGVPFVVNDRADVAALLHAGLHVGQQDLLPRDARAVLGPQSMLGYSTHNADQLRAAAGEPADYLALGPIFSTSSKANPDTEVGLENLRAWRSLTSRPLVAIGGITRRAALDALAAGADSVAVIGDLLPEAGTLASIEERMREWQTTLA